MREMSRYIDADKLIEAIEDSIGYINFSSPYQDDNDAIVEGMERIKSIVDEAPTVDAVPVRHGRWIEDKYPFCNYCHECGAIVERGCIKWNSGWLNY